MSRKVIIILAILVVVTAALIGITLTNQSLPLPGKTPSPTVTIAPMTKLMMAPALLDLTNGSTGVLQVNIDSSTNEITGVQLELQYDPKVLQNVSIEPGTFLTDPLVIRNKVNAATGRISLILGVTPQQNPIKGKGTVATLHFTKAATTQTTTEFKILPTSEVTAQGVDTTVLHDAVGARISL